MSEQLTLNLTERISRRYSGLLECVAACVYRYGLQRAALDLDAAKSNLSTALSGQGRKFGVDDLDSFIAASGDCEPILYLADKYMRESDDPSAIRAKARHLIAKLEALTANL